MILSIKLIMVILILLINSSASTNNKNWENFINDSDRAIVKSCAPKMNVNFNKDNIVKTVEASANSYKLMKGFI